MIEVYDVQGGVERLYQMLEESENKPFVVAVHSPGRDHGKSHFIRESSKRFNENGKVSYGNGDSYELEFLDERDLFDYDVFFIQMPACVDLVCADLDSQKNYGRPCDVNVIVYNPDMFSADIHEYVEGKHRFLKEHGIDREFDFVVENPDSKLK